MSEAVLEALLRRDRVVVSGGLVALIVAAWLYLLYLASAMSDMAMPVMPTMPGMAMTMPALHAWSWVEVGALVVMWGVMMIAMMTLAAAPMILMFSLNAAWSSGSVAAGMCTTRSPTSEWRSCWTKRTHSCFTSGP
jgi:predicted metal-binding membrane protein